jgi:hypothetical protein
MWWWWKVLKKSVKRKKEIEICRFTDLHLHLVYIIRYEPCVSKVEWSQSNNIHIVYKFLYIFLWAISNWWWRVSVEKEKWRRNRRCHSKRPRKSLILENSQHVARVNFIFGPANSLAFSASLSLSNSTTFLNNRVCKNMLNDLHSKWMGLWRGAWNTNLS